MEALPPSAPPEGTAWDWAKPYDAWETWSRDEAAGETRSATATDAAAADDAARLCTGCGGLDRSEERRIFEMSTEAKTQCCLVFHARGDAFQSQGQYYRASLWYQRALSYYEYTFPESDDEIESLEATRLDTLLGLAACEFQVRLFSDVLSRCHQALQIDAGSVRAMHRQAATYTALDLYDEARDALKRGLELAPQDRGLREAAEALRSKRAAYAANRRAQSQRIMQGLAVERGACYTEDAADQSLVTETLGVCASRLGASTASQAPSRSRLAREAKSVVVRPRTVRERDALDDLYAPDREATRLVGEAWADLRLQSRAAAPPRGDAR